MRAGRRARSRPRRLAALAALLASALVAPACGAARPGGASAPRPIPAAWPLRVAPPGGALLGVRLGAREAWLGVPYAAPPLGALRLAAPAAPRPWAGTRPAQREGPGCPQLRGGEVVGAEDCLDLDVSRPSTTAAGLPVAVFIHGGSFVSGAAAGYDPSRLVAAGLVVVEVDYRLGALGFLDAPGTGAAGGDQGLLDQVAALAWVRRSVAAFGGDPGRVLAFGESAGGISVCDLAASPAAAGLLAAAIDQSGPCAGPGAGPTSEVAASRAGAFAAAVGCPGAAPLPCLRRAPVAALLRGAVEQPGGPVPLPWEPATATAALPAPAATLLAASRTVPLLEGTDLDEGASFVPAGVVDAASYRAWLAATFGALAGRVAAAYPLPPAAGAAAVRAVAVRVDTDAGLACPAVALAAALAARPSAGAWGYELTDRRLTGAASHGIELRYLFGPAGGAGLPAAVRPLAAVVVVAWADMAARGAPPAGWPPLATGLVERLGAAGAAPAAGYAAGHRCGVWAALGVVGGPG